MVLVLNNGDLNMVTWEQRVMRGRPASSRIRRCCRAFPYAEYAERSAWAACASSDPTGGGRMGRGARSRSADAAGHGDRPQCAAVPPHVKREAGARPMRGR